MALLKFFRVPKHHQFTYKPRYWAPKKEELDERLQRIEEIQNNGVEASKARISGSFRKSYKGNHKYRKAQIRRSNVMLFIVIAVLLFITYLFLKDLIPDIVNTIE